jgi:hypothetical protein
MEKLQHSVRDFGKPQKRVCTAGLLVESATQDVLNMKQT